MRQAAGGTGRICTLASGLVVFGMLVVLSPPPADAQSSGTGEVTFKATSANVKEPGVPVRIRITRWSTDEERTPVLAALNPAARVAPPADAAARGRGAPPAGRGAAGRGGAGRGGPARGGADPLNPIAALTTAIGKEPTLGYIWTNEVTGYSIKYAYHAPLPDGGERIVLATDRRLGGYTAGWTPAATTPLTDYEFTVVEMRLDAKGSGEAKTSLTTKVVVDPDAKTLALDNYAGTPAILQNVKR
jgi:hypothetical protein